MAVLSVSISANSSSSCTKSPTPFSHFTSPSVTDSAKGGVETTVSSPRREVVWKTLWWPAMEGKCEVKLSLAGSGVYL